MAPSPPPGFPPPPGPGAPTTFGKYVLEGRMAVGAVSEVYLARPRFGTQPASRLVVKRLLPMFLGDANLLGTFAVEARLHRAVRHPNVVAAYETGVVGGEPYLAMEHVAGVDLARLLRLSQSEGRALPTGLVAFVARRLCRALAAVHGARDERGMPLGIVHRDVTPSNVFLSVAGEVKLGDFGIASAEAGRSERPPSGAVIKGKYNYLAPEQVAGEAYDARSDLFSLATLVAEMLIGGPLFAGGGQLAVLLAVRDCRTDALHAASVRAPPALIAVLEHALQKLPAARFPSAEAFGEALAPFDVDPGAEAELRARVARAGEALSGRGPGRGVTGRVFDARTHQGSSGPPPPDTFERITAEFSPTPSRLRSRRGVEIGPLTFARLIELAVTGQVDPDDEVDLMGQGFRPVAEVELVARHVPERLGQAARTLRGPGSAFPPGVTPLEVLGQLAREQATGMVRFGGDEAKGREIYVAGGALEHVASEGDGDLLGQSLVRRGILTPLELDLALAMLAQFDGRLGDTLVGLGLVEPVALFRAIRDQGRDRLVRLVTGAGGAAHFYRGARPQRVDFPLDLPLAEAMLDCAEALWPGDTPLGRYAGANRRPLRRKSEPQGRLPPPVEALLAAIAGAEPLGPLLARASRSRLAPPDALRALDVALALGLVEWAG